MIGGPVANTTGRIGGSSRRLARIRHARIVVFGLAGGLVCGWIVDRPYVHALHDACLQTVCTWDDVHLPPGTRAATFMVGGVAVVAFLAATVRRTSVLILVAHDAFIMFVLAVSLSSVYETATAVEFDRLPLPPPLWLPVIVTPMLFFGVHLLTGGGFRGFLSGLMVLVGVITALHFTVVALQNREQRDAHRTELAGLRIPRVLPRIPGWQVTDVWVNWGSTSMSAVLSGPDGAEMRIRLGSPDDPGLATSSDFVSNDPSYAESRTGGLIVRVVVAGPGDPKSVSRQAAASLAAYSVDDLLPAAVRADSVELIVMPSCGPRHQNTVTAGSRTSPRTPIPGSPSDI